MLSQEEIEKARAKFRKHRADRQRREAEAAGTNTAPVVGPPLTAEQINKARAALGLGPLPSAEDTEPPAKSFTELMSEYRQKNSVSAVVAFQECAKLYPQAYKRARGGR
jgi:hypothetical protein